MFNPSSFNRGLPNTGMYSRITDNLLLQPQKSIAVIPVDKYLVVPYSKRTRWDQPLSLVPVLYTKLGLPLPEELRKQQKSQSQYSPALLDFIKRCYEKCSNEAENKRMEGLLRKIIQQAESKLHLVNWAEFEVPQIPKIQPPQPPRPMIIEPVVPAQPLKVEVREYKPAPAPEVRSLPKEPKRLIGAQENKLIQVKDLPESVKGRSTKLEEKADKVLAKLKAKQITAEPEPESVLKKFERYQRFKGQVKPEKKQSKERPMIDIQDQELQAMTDDWKIIGTSQSLQKQYLRITGMPDPKTVRPEPVLKKVLEYLRSKSRQGETYEYIIWQFRSLRQDLLIQHIKNSFAVECYEENSRISLEEGDMGQYNQCQSALWDLYKSGIYFTKESMSKYIGFQLLSLILELKDQQFEHMLVRLEVEQLESEYVQNVLKYVVVYRRLRRALKIGNYPELFRFYRSQDITTRSLVDQYMEKLKTMCLAMMCKTFGEKVKLELVASLLGVDRSSLEELILSVGGVIRDGEFMLKLSNEALQSCQYLMQRKKNVYLQ